MTTVQIPGYRIVRELGKGGMATVYLAIQEKFGRDIAIKIMDKKMAKDPTFSARFQRESKIVGTLNHPHIIQVFDVGLFDDHHYLAMELLLGGELNDRLEEGLEVSEAFRIIKEIAKALDYAHGKGFIHRDIKPENILFREEGSAVLSDFGIARDVENEDQITQLGSVVGTPYYMSPEQASGEKLDGRSDLYSLGVVFFKTLTGSIPYDGSSAVEIGIKHIKEPVPKLPMALSELQPLIDRFMAKSPEERFQTGMEVVRALEEFERNNPLPKAVIKTEIISADDIDKIRRSTGQQRANTAGNTRGGGQRQRPSVTRVVSVQPRKGSSMGWLVIGIIIAACIGAGAVYWMSIRNDPVAVTEFSETLARWVPGFESADAETLERRLGGAATALAGGPAEKIVAVRTYRELVVDFPHRAEPARGLAEARAALAADIVALPLEQAVPVVEQARAALGDDAVVVDLEAGLARRLRVAELLARAQQAQDEGRLMQPPGNSAFSFYQQALSEMPGNADALAGMRGIAEALLGRAEDALAADDMSSAVALIERARLAAPDLPALAALDARLRSEADRAGDFAQRLGRAEGFLASGALVAPAGANALELYRGVLAEAPGDYRAREGLIRVAEALVARGRQALEAGDQPAALADLARAREIGVAAPGIEALEAELDQRVARGEELLARLEAQLEAGALTRPEDSSALALMEQIDSLGVAGKGVESLRAALVKRLLGVAEEARTFGMLEEARHYGRSASRVAAGDPAPEAFLASLADA